MLLRNYYSLMTYAAIAGTNEAEGVTEDLSPTYSRRTDGTYFRYSLPSFIPFKENSSTKFFYGRSVYQQGSFLRIIWFGNNTTEPNFNDYAPQSDYNEYIDSSRTSYNLTYDDVTKTYTSVELFTLINSSSNDLPINEIMIGFCYGTDPRSTSFAISRDILGNNSFVLEAGESVKFELTIKYTIAEPLR